jgi:hypothetical protein
VRGQEQRHHRDREHRNGQDEAHQFRRSRARTRPPRVERDRAWARRCGRSAMEAIRWASLIVGQPPISSGVRPQPMQRADSGSRTLTLTQGVETLGTALT